MNHISILIGKRWESIEYLKAFANRELAERQKMELELIDTLDKNEGWEYSIQDEIVLEKI